MEVLVNLITKVVLYYEKIIFVLKMLLVFYNWSNNIESPKTYSFKYNLKSIDPINSFIYYFHEIMYINGQKTIYVNWVNFTNFMSGVEKENWQIESCGRIYEKGGKGKLGKIYFTEIE